MTASVTETGYEELAAALRGDLIRPGDPGYDQARAVYNAMIDKRPAAIARCRDTADVIAAVRFARDHDLTITVRGGGVTQALNRLAVESAATRLRMAREPVRVFIRASAK